MPDFIALITGLLVLLT